MIINLFIIIKCTVSTQSFITVTECRVGHRGINVAVYRKELVKKQPLINVLICHAPHAKILPANHPPLMKIPTTKHNTSLSHTLSPW